MENSLPEAEEIERLRKQRNLFAVLAVVSVATIGLALPHKVASYRELKAVNAHLVDLQAAIVANEDATRTVQGQIVDTQKEIAKRMAK